MTAVRYWKRPRPATAIAGRTGPETVLEARDGGSWVLTEDSIGRTHERVRANRGWWVSAPAPCDNCRQPTADRVYFRVGDQGWRPLHHHPC